MLMVVGTYHVIKAYRSKGLGGNKYLYYMTLIYFFINAMLCILNGLQHVFYCGNVEITKACSWIGAINYAIQYLLIWHILFYRLHYVFKRTPSELKRSTFYIANIYYIVVVLTGIICMTLWIPVTRTYFKQNQLYRLALRLCLLGQFLGILWIIWVIGLFIYKLMHISRNTANDDDGKMKSIATKQFLLTLASILTFILVALASNFLGTSIFVYFLSSISYALDLLTNYLSILLGYKRFDSYYKILCGKCHAKIVGRNHEIQLTKSMKSESISDPPATSNASSATTDPTGTDLEVTTTTTNSNNTHDTKSTL